MKHLSHFPLIISPFYGHVDYKAHDDQNFECKWQAVSVVKVQLTRILLLGFNDSFS